MFFSLHEALTSIRYLYIMLVVSNRKYERDNFMEVTVKHLKRGESGTVKRVVGEGAVRRRLFDMGITPGAVITMRKTAPFGDPIEITVRGYQLSIRKIEADSVIVEKGES